MEEALFFGGATSSGEPLVDGAAYDTTKRTWTMLPNAPLSPDRVQAVVWTGTQMVVIQPAKSAAFEPATNRWTVVPALPQASGLPPDVIGEPFTVAK